jgi:hypothetical protein
MEGLSFKVSGFQGLTFGFRVYGLMCRVYGVGYRI